MSQDLHTSEWHKQLELNEFLASTKEKETPFHRLSTMSAKSPAKTSFEVKEKEFEEIDLEPIHSVVGVQSLSNQPSQDGDQNTTGRRIVTEEEAREHTAYAYGATLKRSILAIAWVVSSIIKYSLQSSESR